MGELGPELLQEESDLDSGRFRVSAADGSSCLCDCLGVDTEFIDCTILLATRDICLAPDGHECWCWLLFSSVCVLLFASAGDGTFDEVVDDDEDMLQACGDWFVCCVVWFSSKSLFDSHGDTLAVPVHGETCGKFEIILDEHDWKHFFSHSLWQRNLFFYF